VTPVRSGVVLKVAPAGGGDVERGHMQGNQPSIAAPRGSRGDEQLSRRAQAMSGSSKTSARSGWARSAARNRVRRALRESQETAQRVSSPRGKRFRSACHAAEALIDAAHGQETQHGKVRGVCKGPNAPHARWASRPRERRAFQLIFASLSGAQEGKGLGERGAKSSGKNYGVNDHHQRPGNGLVTVGIGRGKRREAGWG